MADQAVVSAQDQLRALQRLFPRAVELAVSPELARQFELELVTIQRFTAVRSERLDTHPVEAFASGLKAQRLPFKFRNARLTQVWR